MFRNCLSIQMGVKFVTTRPIGNLSLARQKTGQKSDKKDKNIKLICVPVSVKYEGPGKIFEGSRDKNLLITLTHIWLPTHHKRTEGQRLFPIHFWSRLNKSELGGISKCKCIFSNQAHTAIVGSLTRGISNVECWRRSNRKKNKKLLLPRLTSQHRITQDNKSQTGQKVLLTHTTVIIYR